MSEFYEKIKETEKRGDVYIIAEVGSNFKTIDDLKNSIALAKSCGANAVKFQYFTESELYGPKPEIDKEFPLSQLHAKCEAAGIDFLCSSFSPDGMKEVDKFVSAHKIASSEMAHLRMLETAKALKKPVILSTGGYTVTDIARVLNFMEGHEVILMHCNLSYPTKFTDIEKFLTLKSRAPGPIGYSDHTTSVDAVPVFYRTNGVSVYEKHFNPFDYTDTPDAPHSLNVKEFKTFSSFLRGAPSPYSEENEAKLKFVRRLIATVDLMPGEVLKENVNFGIFRSRNEDARGANPFSANNFEGKIVTREIKAGEGLAFADIQ